MGFCYTKENLSPREQKLQRIFETIPGAISWMILLGMLMLSFLNPVLASITAIAFILYWFLRLVYMTIFLVLSFAKLHSESKTDWLSRMEQLKVSNQTINDELLDPNDILQVVILPVAKEPYDVIAPSLKALSVQTLSTKRMFVLFAVEEKAPEKTKKAVLKLIHEYKEIFYDFQSVLHPANIPGEARVKGANASCAAKYAARILNEKKIAFDKIIVSCFDADTVVDKQYFACLTYYFLITPERLSASYQPIPVYNNNIWSVPGFSRVMEIGSSFFQLIESTNPEKLVTFSSHSMSFKTLVEMDYWPRDMISDDSAIFWKAYIHYQGRYKVVPMYITVSMDATVADHWWLTIKNIYKQRSRWAYGVENFPILTRGFLQTPKISLYNKIRHIFKMLEGHVSWATWGFLLTTLGWLPALLAKQEYQSTIIYYNEPHIAGTIFRLSSFSLIISIFLSLALLPKPQTQFGWLKKSLHVLEWWLMPFVIVFLSALPALDAQTRLMFGKYMEFWVTDKSRKPSL
jgi:hypothetical protein